MKILIKKIESIEVRWGKRGYFLFGNPPLLSSSSSLSSPPTTSDVFSVEGVLSFTTTIEDEFLVDELDELDEAIGVGPSHLEQENIKVDITISNSPFIRFDILILVFITYKVKAIFI